jgi:hypothetical protein
MYVLNTQKDSNRRCKVNTRHLLTNTQHVLSLRTHTRNTAAGVLSSTHTVCTGTLRSFNCGTDVQFITPLFGVTTKLPACTLMTKYRPLYQFFHLRYCNTS